MTIRGRSMVLAAFLAVAAIAYGVARKYSPSLVLYVVEQSLVQKAPPGTSPAGIQARLHKLLSTVPDQNGRMQRLFRISEFLEKVQTLTPEELNELVPAEGQGSVL